MRDRKRIQDKLLEVIIKTAEKHGCYWLWTQDSNGEPILRIFMDPGLSDEILYIKPVDENP